MTSRPYFLCVENYDRGEHHYRVYEPVGGDHEDAWREGGEGSS
ncbi:hypothetical protein [Thermogemmatispora sp.]|nr:hypothetical protein [Thermogemmatispora sp.]